jgi:arylsulfatase A-like enzyme
MRAAGAPLTRMTRAAAGALVVALSAVLASSSPPNKNILFAIEDDGGLDLGPYGSPSSPTPHLASLAARGTVLDNFLTTVSSCSPSRASLMSGLPTHQNGMYGLQHSVEHFTAFEDVRSVMNVLNDNGYVTGILGKYHVWLNTSFTFSWGNNPSGPGGCQAGASSACPAADYNLVSRNITYMREQASLFFDYAASLGKPFFLYVGFGDSHRCGGAVGEFCELYGLDPRTNASTIPDWTPRHVDPATIDVPFWVQDTPIARSDRAKMLVAKDRMDQGVGLLLTELTQRGLDDSTMIIYTADNGAPFAAGKTNMYEPATVEPFIATVPGAKGGVRSSVLASTLDLFPTWLDWAGIPLPVNYTVLGNPVTFTGKSLLPFIGGAGGAATGTGDSTTAGKASSFTKHRLLLTREEIAAQRRRTSPLQQLTASSSSSSSSPLSRRELRQRLRALPAPPPLPSNYSAVYGSFQHHEIQEYFPMRSVTATTPSGQHYRLILNIAHWLPYPIAEDLWSAPAVQDLLARERAGQPTEWYRNVTQYFFTPDARGAWELFDVAADPEELTNLASAPAYAGILATLQADLKQWQTATFDDWLVKYTHE